MSEHDRSGPASGIEYDSPLAEYSEDASSAIGPVMESSTSLALDASQDDSKHEASVEDSAKSVPQQSSGDSTGTNPIERRRDTITTENQGTQHQDDDDADGEGDDEDDEESEEDEDEDESESEEDDEEEEPVLKYEKIGNAVGDILEKDVASAIAVGGTYFAVGTHNGLVHLFSLRGSLLKTYRPHSASITDICISTSSSESIPIQPHANQSILPSFSLFPASFPATPRSATPALKPEAQSTSPASTIPRASSPQPPLIISDTIATASLDGQAILHALSTATTTGHNFKRPLRTIALEPNYANSPSKSYVSGGMAGELVLTSKSHLSMGGLENVLGGLGLGGGGAQTNKIIHSGEGPIWIVRWKGDIIAWSNDLGVRLYSVSKGERIAFVDRPKDSPRADLFQCSLTWRRQRTSTSASESEELIIGWADLLKVVRISTRSKLVPSQPGPRKDGATGSLGIVGGAGIAPLPPGGTETVVEVTKVLRLDCMIAGVQPWPFEEGTSGKVAHEGVTQTVGIPTSATTAPILDATTTNPAQTKPVPTKTDSFLFLSYIPARTLLSSESTSRSEQRRQTSKPPELRIVTSEGYERSSDLLAMKGYDRWACTDYRILESFPPPYAPLLPKPDSRLRERDHGGWLILSPKGVVIARKRDRMDRVAWLVERERYEEALGEMDAMEKDGEYIKSTGPREEDTHVMTKDEIGRMYLSHLFKQREYEKAAKLCPTVLGADSKAWEDWIFQFRHVNALKVLVPFVPFKSPRLSKVAYGIILDYYLRHDAPALSQAIKDWPSEIYDVPALINAIPQPPPTVVLMECLADLYIRNRQPGKALQYFLRLRRPNVFQLIRDNHLFTDVQDQALLLVEFDQELMKQREHLRANQPKPDSDQTKQSPSNKSTSNVSKSPAKRAATDSAVGVGGGGGVFQALFSAALPTSVFGGTSNSTKAPLLASTSKPAAPSSRPQLSSHTHTSSYWTSENANEALPDESYVAARGEAIPLLVEHSHSIPIAKVVSQLETRPDFLFLYLDALFDKDPELCSDYLERQVELYAQFRKGRVIRLLQTAQNLQIALPFEKIYKICEDKNMVPEMVWVRSRMGDNKGALFLIIDRLGDVSRAIDFAKERKDDDLWEDLLRYSETRPTFIKALLENVTTEIDPIRIIRRIRNGLEIPGLKESIIKILQDFNLQISLMEGCGNVLESDCEVLARRLQRAQAGGQIGIPNGICLICSKPLLQVNPDLVLVFLCGHLVHAHCASGGAGLPKQADSSLVGIGLGTGRDFGAKLAYAEMVKRRLDQGCPVHQKLEQGESSLTAPALLSHHSHRHKGS